jgi:hypothetical protein
MRARDWGLVFILVFATIAIWAQAAEISNLAERVEACSTFGTGGQSQR